MQPSYKLCIQVKRADRLPRSSSGSTPSACATFQLHGSSQIERTKIVKDDTNPIFNDTLFLDGFFVGSDLLHVWVTNQNDQDPSNVETLGYAQVMIGDLMLGCNQNVDIKLFPYDNESKTYKKGSNAGEAGVLSCIIHLAQPDDTPFKVKEWKYPLYQAWFDILETRNCPDNAKLYLKVSITPAANVQTFKTNVKENGASVIWNQRARILLDNYPTQTIHVELINADGNNSVASLDIPLQNNTIGNVDDVNTQMVPAGGEAPLIHYRIQILAKGSDPFRFIPAGEEFNFKIINIQTVEETVTKQITEEVSRSKEEHELIIKGKGDDHCGFSWSGVDSSYSTSFTGYSHKGHSISSHSSDINNTWHLHDPVVKDNYVKPKKDEIHKVSIVGVEDIPVDEKDNKLVITFQRLTVSGVEKSPLQRFDVDSEKFVKEITLERPKPGQYLEFLVYQDVNGTNKLIGGRRLKIKDINFDDNDKQYIKLLSPQQLEQNQNQPTDGKVGKIVMTFKRVINFK